MAAPNPIISANLLNSSQKTVNSTKSKDGNENQSIEPKETNTAVSKLNNLWDVEKLKKNLERQQKRQALKDSNKTVSSAEVDEQGELPEALKETLQRFPDLLKFIMDNEKAKDQKNELLKKYGLGILERALFRSIEKQDVDFVEQLILLDVDVDCAAIEPVAVDSHRKNIIKPLYYSLTWIYSSQHFGVSFSGPLDKLNWTHLEAAKRSQIIEALIMAGARIDDPSVEDGESPFLHRLCIAAIKFPDMLRVLLNVLEVAKDINLNLNRVAISSNETPLALLIYKIIDWYRSNKDSIEPFLENCKKIVKVLITNSEQNYTFSIKRSRRTYRLFDRIINEAYHSVLRLPLARTLQEILNAIFKDMALQACNYVATLKIQNIDDIEKKLLAYAYNNFLQEESYYGFYPFFGPKRDIKGRIIASEPHSIAIHDKIVVPALKIIKNQYSLGYSLSEIQRYFSSGQFMTLPENLKIDPLWHIVIEYCFEGNLAYLYAAHQLRQQGYPLETLYTKDSEGLNSTVVTAQDGKSKKGCFIQ